MESSTRRRGGGPPLASTSRSRPGTSSSSTLMRHKKKNNDNVHDCDYDYGTSTGTRMTSDDARAALGSRAGRIDAARSRLSSAGNSAMYTGGPHWGKRIGVPPSGAPMVKNDEATTTAFGEVLRDNPHHATTLLRPAMLQRVTRTTTPFDKPVGLGSSSQKPSMNNRRNYATTPRTKGKQMEEEAAQLSGWINSLKGNLPPRKDDDDDDDDDDNDRGWLSAAAGAGIESPSPSNLGSDFDDYHHYHDRRRPGTSAGTLVNVLTSHDSLFGTGAQPHHHHRHHNIGGRYDNSCRPGTSSGGGANGHGGGGFRGRMSSSSQQRGHHDFEYEGFPGFEGGGGGGGGGGAGYTMGKQSGGGGGGAGRLDGGGAGEHGDTVMVTPRSGHHHRAYSPASSSFSAYSHGGGVVSTSRRSSARFGGRGSVAGYMLESEAAAAAAARAQRATESWTRFTLKLTARRDHAIKLALDGAERRASRRPLGGLRASLEQTVQLARVAALYEDSYARMAVAAAGGVDVLVSGEGSKLSDAVGVSTRAAHEAAERSRAKSRQGTTTVIEPDGTVKYFNKEGKPMAAAPDEGRSRERLDIISQSMVRREAFELIPKARREWLVSKGLLARGGIQPRDRLHEETQRLVDAHELREVRARDARAAATKARKQSWEYVMKGNREKKAAREANKIKNIKNGSKKYGNRSASPHGGGGRDGGGGGGGAGKTAMTTNRPVFSGSLAGSQLVHELIDYALKASADGLFGGARAGGDKGLKAGTREAHERLMQSKQDVKGSLEAAAAAAPDEVILGKPGTAAVLEEAKALRAAVLVVSGGATRGEESFLSKATSYDSESESDDLGERTPVDRRHGGGGGGVRVVGSAPPRGRPTPVRPASTAEVAAEFAYFLRSNEDDVRDSFAAVLGGAGAPGNNNDDGDNGRRRGRGGGGGKGDRHETSGGEGGGGRTTPGYGSQRTGGDSTAWRGRESSSVRIGSARGARDREWAALHHASAVGRDGSLYARRLPSPSVWSGGGGMAEEPNRGRALYGELSGILSAEFSPAPKGIGEAEVWVNPEGGDGGEQGAGTDPSPEHGNGEEGAVEKDKEEEEEDPEVVAAAKAAAAAAATARASLRWRAACGQVLLARWRHRNLVNHAGTATPDDRMYFRHFSRRLSRFTSTLDLTATAFGLRHAALLGPFLQVHVGVVRNLSLARNPLAPRATAIAAAAVQLAAGTVARLDLAACSLSPTHVPRLQSLLLPSAGPAAGGLTELVLSDNSFGDAGFSGLAACLCGEYSGLSVLRRLEVSNCGLGIIAANAIGGVLRMNRTLEELDVSRNTFGSTGAAHIAGGVAENDRLTVLDLTSCQVGGMGAAVIANALLPGGGGGFEDAVKGNDNNANGAAAAALKVLSAVGGGVGRGAWRAQPGTGVVSSKSIKDGLKLVGDLGSVAQLAAETTGNTALRELWIGDNNIDNRAVFGLLAVMAVHPNLDVLELRSNPLGPAAARRLIRAFLAKPEFARLGLAGVTLTVQKVKGIAELSASASEMSDSGIGGLTSTADGVMCGWEHFDEGNPAGLTFQLRLSDPFGRQAAIELCHEWWNRDGDAGSGKEVWRECFIERSEGGVKAGTVQGKEGKQTAMGAMKGEPFTLKPFHDWPARLPERGDLTVTLGPRRVEDFPTPAERAADGVMSSKQFEAAWDGVIVDATQLGAVGATAASATAAWRLNYARVLSDAVWITPSQAVRIVNSFDWPADRVDILARLIPRLVDTADRPGIRALAAAVGSATWRGTMKILGYHRLLCEDNPTGAYNLNLSAPLDRLAAGWLREDAIAGSKKLPGRCGWRNVRLNGVWVTKEGVSRTTGTTDHRALSAWKLPPRGVISFDHVGAPLGPPPDHRGTLRFHALTHLEMILRSPPPYPPASRVLANADDAAEEAARQKAARARERKERRCVAEIEASKARLLGKEISADLQAALDVVDSEDEEDDDGEENNNNNNDNEDVAAEGGGNWGEMDDEAEEGDMVRDKLRRTMQIADVEKSEAEAEAEAEGEGKSSSSKTVELGDEKHPRLSRDDKSFSSKFASSPTPAVEEASQDSSNNNVVEGGGGEKILTKEEIALAKLELLRAIADVHRPTAKQAVSLLRASGLLKREEEPSDTLEGAVPGAIPGATSASSLGGEYDDATGRSKDKSPPPKWPSPTSSSLRSGLSHVPLSTDMSWGPPESHPSQFYTSTGVVNNILSPAMTAATAAAIGFYARLAYPPHAESGTAFATVLEILPRAIQLDIHDRLGSSATVPTNVVMSRGGLDFRLRMSDYKDASVAKRLARLRVKAGTEGAMTRITMDGKPVKDVDDKDPGLWTRLWSRARGRAVIEFHIECTERGIARARVATVQSLWKRHVARRKVARLRFIVTTLVPRIGKRWLARARATIEKKRLAAADLEQQLKQRAAENVSHAFGDGALEKTQDATLLDTALAEDDQSVLALGNRARRNWADGVRLGRRRRLAERQRAAHQYSDDSSSSDDEV